MTVYCTVVLLGDFLLLLLIAAFVLHHNAVKTFMRSQSIFYTPIRYNILFCKRLKLLSIIKKSEEEKLKCNFKFILAPLCIHAHAIVFETQGGFLAHKIIKVDNFCKYFFFFENQLQGVYKTLFTTMDIIFYVRSKS